MHLLPASMAPTVPFFRLQNVTSHKDCLRIEALKASFSEDGVGGECLAANPGHTGFWSISSHNPRADLFINPAVVPSIPSGGLDLTFYFDASFKGFGIASTAERRTAHLVVWNRGAFVPRLRSPKLTPYSSLALQPNTRTMISGHGEGAIIEIDWVHLWLRLGADDETQYSRAWVRDTNWYMWDQLPVPNELYGHDWVPLRVHSMATGYHTARRHPDNKAGVLCSSPDSQSQGPRLFVLKHLNMLKPDSNKNTCISMDLRELCHVSVYPLVQWSTTHGTHCQRIEEHRRIPRLVSDQPSLSEEVLSHRLY